MEFKEQQHERHLYPTTSETKLYPALEEPMSTKDAEKCAPLDDVDFTSGFETQYEQEYRPLRPKVTVPKEQDSKTLWYRDLKTILMVTFLMAIFLMGTIILTKMVFTANPLYVAAITAVYVIFAIVMILVEVKSIHVRNSTVLLIDNQLKDVVLGNANYVLCNPDDGTHLDHEDTSPVTNETNSNIFSKLLDNWTVTGIAICMFYKVCILFIILIFVILIKPKL